MAQTPPPITVPVEIDWTAVVSGFRTMADAFTRLGDQLRESAEHFERLAEIVKANGVDKESTTR